MMEIALASYVTGVAVLLWVRWCDQGPDQLPLCVVLGWPAVVALTLLNVTIEYVADAVWR